MGWSNKGGKGGYNMAMAYMPPHGYDQAMQQQMMYTYPNQNLQMGYKGKGWGKGSKGKGKGELQAIPKTLHALAAVAPAGRDIHAHTPTMYANTTI
jgi:hypothetical protein